MSAEEQAVLDGWKEFYRERGIALDLVKIRVPEKVKGITSLHVTAEGVTPLSLYRVCKDIFPCFKIKESILNEVMSERSTHQGPYAFRMRGHEQPDDEFKNISAEHLKALDKISFGTLEEGILFYIKYYFENGVLPDKKMITLCPGSRFAWNDVPGLDTSFGKMRIHYYHPDFAHNLLCPRMVII